MKSTRDVNALVFNPDKPADPRAKHFIPREGARNKALEISFDPKAHKEWVTGFRKRKNERKTAAIKGLEERAKRERLEERQQRFKLKKERLHLPDNYGVEDSDVDEPDNQHLKITDQTVYRGDGVTTTVTTAAIDFDPNDGDVESGSDDNDDDMHEDSDGGGGHTKSGGARTISFPASADDVQVEAGNRERQHARGDRNEEASTQPSGAAGKKGDGPTPYTKLSNKLAVLKAKKGGTSKKLLGPGKGKRGKVKKAKAGKRK